MADAGTGRQSNCKITKFFVYLCNQMDTLDKKYYKIAEVAEMIGVPASTLRFWENEFPQVKPVRNAGGSRFYTPANVETLRMIYFLVREKGLRIEAARQALAANRSGVLRHADAVRRLREVRSRLTGLLDALTRRH